MASNVAKAKKATFEAQNDSEETIQKFKNDV